MSVYRLKLAGSKLPVSGDVLAVLKVRNDTMCQNRPPPIISSRVEVGESFPLNVVDIPPATMLR